MDIGRKPGGREGRRLQAGPGLGGGPGPRALREPGFQTEVEKGVVRKREKEEQEEEDHTGIT